MSDMYQILPCPKCGADCWRRDGGHHSIPFYYVCTTCGMDTNRIKEALPRVESTT